MMYLRFRAPLVAAVVVIAALAAPMASAQADDKPIVVGQTFLTPGLDPAEGNAGWALTSHGVTENLFMVDEVGAVTPALAESAERREDGSWIVRLRPDRFFSDGTPVDGETVASGLNRTVDTNPAARASAGSIIFAAGDELTLEISTERPTPILPSVLAEWPFAVYKPAAEDGGAHLFTGPYVPTGFQPGGRLDLEPNRHHVVNADHSPVTLIRVADGQALALGLKSGEIDFAFNLPVEALSMIGADDNLTVKTFPVGYQYMMWLNTRRTALEPIDVRQAIALAVDRGTLARALRSGQPSASLWATTFPFGGADAPEADPEAASALLDAAGWLPGTDGIREKDGERLVLTLWAYPQRPDLITMQPVLSAMLRKIGIAVESRVAENASALASEGTFDLLLWAQHTAPAADPAFFPSLFLASGAPNNFAGWSNETLDQKLATLAETSDTEGRNELAAEIDDLVRDDAPVIVLLTPEWHVGLSERVAGYEPWGSDYFIIRADMGKTR